MSRTPSEQPLAAFVLKIGPLEMVVVVLWGLTQIATLNDSRVSKGLLAGFFGLMLSQIGISTTGVMRTSVGMPNLIDGLLVVPAMIGIFAASELLRLRGETYLVRDDAQRDISFGRILKGAGESFHYPGRCCWRPSRSTTSSAVRASSATRPTSST